MRTGSNRIDYLVEEAALGSDRGAREKNQRAARDRREIISRCVLIEHSTYPPP